MYTLRLIFLYQLLLVAIFFSETVKIGISKPLPVTTTMPPPSTTVETTTEEEITTEAVVGTTISSTTTVTPKTTSITKPTTTESDWPEFPPKKTSHTTNKTAAEKPLTTMIPSTSTISTDETDKHTSTANELETPQTSFQKIWPSKQKYCVCDLTNDVCDINCCCDHDCSLEAFKVFRCFEEKPDDFGPHDERGEDFKFQHGLPSCEIKDGWLCVFRTYKPLAEGEPVDYIKDTTNYYKWPNFLLESEEITSREFYKFGDLLRIINTETKEIHNFDLPSSFESSSCSIQEPIYHLKAKQRYCLISSFENLRQIQLNLLQLQEKYKIFNTPNIPEDLYNNKHLENFVGNITIYKCLGNQQNCSRYYRHDHENIENYLMAEVKVNILHNFTHVKEAVVNLWLEEVKTEKYSTALKKDYWLSYEIEFFNGTFKEFNAKKWNNMPKPTIVSGPLGYLTGKPLIIARYEPFNKSQALSANNQVLTYFSVNNTESHTLDLLGKESGECKFWTSEREHIDYGINEAKYCKIKLENDSFVEEKPSAINFTEVCLNVQNHINNQLFGPDLVIEDLSSYFISRLGKPQNNSNKWLQLQVYNTDFESVIGQYLAESNTFVCRNILLNVAYEFHIANAMVDNVAQQKVINHAVLHLAERHDLEFSLNENLEVPITMTVRFFNVHEKAVSAGVGFENFHLVFYIILVFVSFLY